MAEGGATEVLIRFTVQNFRSFREPATLDMTATGLTSPDPDLDRGAIHVVTDKLRLLKAAAIYGANASGKSNLVRALNLMKGMVQKSATLMQPLPYDPFRLNSDSRTDAVEFEALLWRSGLSYRYGFAFDGERIRKEWLFRTAKRETPLFIRDAEHYDVRSGFPEGRGLKSRTRERALFLSVVAQFNGAIAQEVTAAFDELNVVSGLTDAPLLELAHKALGASLQRQRVVSLLGSLDTAVLGLQLEERDVEEALSSAPEPVRALVRQVGLETAFRVLSEHIVREGARPTAERVMFDLDDHESAGTARLVWLAPALLDTLDAGKTLVVDEFDARLHPRLTREIMARFNSGETNPRGAQLIVATHGTHLLSRDLLRRDQVWFVEKNEREESTLYSLAEFKTRKDDLFDRQYILGRYGAVPVLTGVEEALRASPPA